MVKIESAFMRKAYIFLFLIIGIIIVGVSYIYPNISKMIETNTTGIAAVGGLSKGVTIKEDIYIPKHIKEFKLLFATYRRKNKGTIKVKVKQENVEIFKIIDVSEIKDNKYKKIDLKFSKLKEGKATLIIEGIDSVPEKSVSIYKTDDVSLGSFSINNIKMNKGIIFQMKYFSVNIVTKIQLYFLALSIGIYFFIVSLLKKNDKKSNRKVYFLTAILIYFLINIKAPTLSFSTEPYAEIVTNFLNNGLYINKFNNIWITDAGYWPLFQRIIGLIVIKLFGINPKITVIIMQNTAILIISLICSLFILKEYSKYGNNFFRLAICLMLGSFTLVPYNETHTFINFSYFCLVVLILVSLLNIDKLSKLQYIILSIILFFMCISKSHFVILLPIIVMFFVFLYKKLSLREKKLLIILQISLLIQIIYTVRNISRWINDDSEKLEFSKIFSNVLHQLIQQTSYIFYPDITGNLNGMVINIYFLILLVIVIIICLYFLKVNKNRESIILVSLLMLIFGTATYNSVIRIWYFDINWLMLVERIENRHTIFIKISMIFVLVLLIYNLNIWLKKNYPLITKVKTMKMFYNIIALILMIRLGISDKNAAIKSEEAFSDWKVYSEFYKNRNYLIPIEPFNWVSVRGEKIHYFAKDLKDFVFVDTRNRIETLDDQIHELILSKPIKMEYIYLQRLRSNNFDKLRIILYEKNGQPISELVQLNKKERKFIGFKNDILDKEVGFIKVFNENMEEAYVIPEIFIGEPEN